MGGRMENVTRNKSFVSLSQPGKLRKSVTEGTITHLQLG